MKLPYRIIDYDYLPLIIIFLLCFLHYVGYFANFTGLSSCLVCPASFECTGGTIDPAPCPQGHYCLIGDDSTTKGIKQACPEGTFGSRTGLSLEIQCEDCPGGKYCQGTAKKNYTGICDPGYFCRRRTTRSSPSDDSVHTPKWFGRCPIGGWYCEADTIDPQPCNPGSYAPNGQMMITSASKCTKCKAGYFCASGNQSDVTGPCDDGFYCLEGSYTSRPSSPYGERCPAGYKCPSGSPWPEACPKGSYQNATGQKDCLECPAGYFCSGNTTNPEICPSGYYCPKNSYAGTTFACQPGTFNNLTGRTQKSDCIPCTPGFYCNIQGNVRFLTETLSFRASSTYVFQV